MFLFPRALLNAFLRGRKSATNLYHASLYDEMILNKTVGEIRQQIEPSQKKGNSIIDYIYFMLWWLLALVYHIALVLLFLKTVSLMIHYFTIWPKTN